MTLRLVTDDNYPTPRQIEIAQQYAEWEPVSRSWAVAENELVTDRAIFWNGYGFGFFSATLAIAAGCALWAWVLS